MNAAVAEKGYAATTIADVVRHARVSRRTFYEHFDDKRDCFLAAYDRAAAHVLGAMGAAAAGGGAWHARVERAVAAYLDAMAARPELTQTFLIEILGAGPRGLARRRATMRRFAHELVALAAELRRTEPSLRPLSPALAIAIVGGINELVLGAVEDGRASELALLREPAAELIRGALAPPAGHGEEGARPQRAARGRSARRRPDAARQEERR